VSLISWIGTPSLLMIETAVHVGRVHGAVLVAEDEVAGVPGVVSLISRLTSVIVALGCGLVPHASSLVSVAAWVAP
jgi:hypothetical protein